MPDQVYRNQFIFNQKGGSIFIDNTDRSEILKLTHYSGSFKEFNNYTTSEFCTNNDQKLVLNDSFLTIRGNRNEYSQGDYDAIIQGNHYKKVGDLNVDVAKQWKAVASDIADVKQLFDIQRTNSLPNQGPIKLTSSKQTKVGKPAPCPVCTASKNTYFAYNNSYSSAFENTANNTVADFLGDYIYAPTITTLGIPAPSVLFPGALGQPIFTSPVGSLGGSIDGSQAQSGGGQIFGDTCPCCHGSALSPSSQDGNWNTDPHKQQITQIINSKLTILANIERNLGVGGSEIIEITKHKVETIGTVFNDLPSVRVDPKGKCYTSEVVIGQFGTFYNRTASPLVEYVHTDDLPGGNYTLTVCNKFDLNSGAGGLNLKSAGPTNLVGAITNIAGTQVNIASQNEVNIDGGKRLSIIADVISIRQRNKQQVLIDSNLGIANNLTVAGGAHVEGELHVNHITAPTEIQATEQSQVFGAAVTDPLNLNGKIIGFGVAMSSYPTPNGLFWTPGVPSITGPPYLGFTDTATIVGYIPIGAVATYAPEYGWVQHDSIDGDAPSPNTVPIPIYGSGKANPCVKGTDLGITGPDGINGSTPNEMIIVVYGTGRDEDSIVMEPHSHLFKNLPLNLTQTNAQVRQAAQAINSYGSIACNPIQNIKK